jgi:alanine racemase
VALAFILWRMHPNKRYATWVEVDLGRIESNVRLLASSMGVPLMGVMKANAYGHGALEVARAAVRGGVAWCGVARAEEALTLRRAGVDCSILVLGHTPAERLNDLIAAGVSMTVWSKEQVEAASGMARQNGERARLHLKVDTGMSRLGVFPQDVLALARRMRQAEGVLFEGLMTHFACADEIDPQPTKEQQLRFEEVLELLEKEGLRPPLVHASNTAAGLCRPSAHYDIVRTGIAMYGLSPSSNCALPDGLLPALAWKSQVYQVKTVPPGSGVSYGFEYRTRGEERLGIISVGYADGFRRVQGNQVLIRGRRAPVVGRVCMDLSVVQLDGIPEVQAGDEVVLIGEQGEEHIDADEVAQRWGTINYEVICGIGARVPRVYL